MAGMASDEQPTAANPGVPTPRSERDAPATERAGSGAQLETAPDSDEPPPAIRGSEQLKSFPPQAPPTPAPSAPAQSSAKQHPMAAMPGLSDGPSSLAMLFAELADSTEPRVQDPLRALSRTSKAPPPPDEPRQRGREIPVPEALRGQDGTSTLSSEVHPPTLRPGGPAYVAPPLASPPISVAVAEAPEAEPEPEPVLPMRQMSKAAQLAIVGLAAAMGVLVGRLTANVGAGDQPVAAPSCPSGLGPLSSGGNGAKSAAERPRGASRSAQPGSGSSADASTPSASADSFEDIPIEVNPPNTAGPSARPPLPHPGSGAPAP